MDRYAELFSVLGSLVAVIPIIFSSERIRSIVQGVFTHPRERTVIITFGDHVLSVENPSAEELRNLMIRLSQQEAKSADAPSSSTEEDAK